MLYLGADFNREIKVWSCSNWDCVQPINLKSDIVEPIETTRHSMFKTSIDLTSNYLVLSDIARKCFYIFHVYSNTEKNTAYCTAVSEFILAFPAISFAIIDSKRILAKKYNQLNNVNSNGQNQANGDFELTTNEHSLNDLLNASSLSPSVSSSNTIQQQNADTENKDLVTMIKLYCIQTKQLQEMQIFLSGEQSVNAYNNNSISPPPPLLMNQQNLQPSSSFGKVLVYIDILIKKKSVHDPNWS